VSEGIYEGYARVYDRSGQRAFSVRMVPYVERLLGGRGHGAVCREAAGRPRRRGDLFG